MTEVITLTPAQYLQQVHREKRARRDVVWIVQDLKSRTLLLSQKLQQAADFINRHLATVDRERVSLAGLYEAADTAGNRVDGCHKMRYKVVSCPLRDSHSTFNQMRNQSGVATAIILTSAPQTYVLREAAEAS